MDPQIPANELPYQAAAVPQQQAVGQIRLNLRTLTGQTFTVHIPQQGSTIRDIKAQLEATQGIPVAFQRLIFGGRELQDEQLVTSIGLENDYTLHLLLRQANPPPQPQPPAPQPVQGGLYAIPVHGNVAMPVDNYPVPMNADDIARLTLTMRLGKAVRMFAIIDIIFLVIWALSYFPLFIGVLLAICGYYGSKSYRRPYIVLYMLYLVAAIALRIVYAVLSSNLFLIVLLVLGALINLYILHLTWKFYQLCGLLREEERIELIQTSRGF